MGCLLFMNILHSNNADYYNISTNHLYPKADVCHIRTNHKKMYL